ncbi:MAG: septal ring lytic transglycosylase RlpA family protein, partial [Rhizobiaceae bacterium]|nr:septal ring lytic transglycosylase RlpA family protein [Rhizobiaceae bacterium]
MISNQTKFSSKAYGVAGSPRVTTSTKVRKGGGRYQIGKPYTIRGVRYVPKEDPNYRATGLASWYGPNFHGRLTANGEVYDQFALSAAHPTMPLPSYAKVTNLENGASVTVRVNDRGPFSRGRIIDLSSRAAQLLGYTKKGVAKVKVEYVGRARMDGLDERQLLASYNSGRLNPNSIPANVRPVIVASANQKTVVKKQAPTVVALVSKPAATRRTLDAFDNSRFGADAPRPKSLVNGYLADQNANIAG